MNKDNLRDRLKEMQSVDIQSVNPKDLVDIDSVTIQKDLPPRERIVDYIRQIKNPYCYLSHGTIIKISFAGTRTLEECLETCLALEQG